MRHFLSFYSVARDSVFMAVCSNALLGGGSFGKHSFVASLTALFLKSVGFHTHPTACSLAIIGPEAMKCAKELDLEKICLSPRQVPEHVLDGIAAVATETPASNF